MTGGVLFFADPHLGMSTHDVTVAGGASWRVQEARRVLWAISEAAWERDASAVVCAGDLYHERRPPAWAYTQALLLSEGLAEGCRFVVDGGNHDTYSVAGKVGPLLATPATAVLRPGFVRLPDAPFDLLVVPYPHRSWMLAADTSASVQDVHAHMAEQLDRIIGGLATRFRADNPDRPLVAVYHGTIAGAAYNSGTQPQLGAAGEFMLPLNAIARPEFLCVMAGHIHKPQSIEGGACPVHYIGSTMRHDFGEEEQACRALYLSGGGAVEQIELPATRFVTVAVSHDSEGYHVGDAKVKDAVCRLKGELPPGPESVAFIQQAVRDLTERGALVVAKPAVTFRKVEARTQHDLRLDMSTHEAVAAYIDLAGGDLAANRAELLAAHDALVQGRDAA